MAGAELEQTWRGGGGVEEPLLDAVVFARTNKQRLTGDPLNSCDSTIVSTAHNMKQSTPSVQIPESDVSARRGTCKDLLTI